MTPLFDRDKNQTSSSFLIIDDINGNLEIPLVKTNDFWQDERKNIKSILLKCLHMIIKIFKEKI